MNKTLRMIALSGLFAGALLAADKATAKSWTDDLALKTTVGFESEYVYRGKELGLHSVQLSVEGAYKLYNGSLYAGVWSTNPVGANSSGANYLTPYEKEANFYVGYKMPVYEKFTADVGATYYWYLDNNQGTFFNNRREIYAGLIYNGLFVNPAAYVFYDFDAKAITGELSGKYSYDLAKFGMANTAVDVGAYVGGVSASDAAAGYTGAGKVHNGYMYWGTTADVVYSITKNASASVGIRYAGNNDGQNIFVNGDFRNSADNLWWGTKLTAGF